MYTITARLTDGTTVLGYELTDGVEKCNLNKKKTWVLAKNKEIINVTASGNLINPVLSGTNGFELKKLPDINIVNSEQNDKRDTRDKKDTENVKYTPQECLSAEIRYRLSGNAVPGMIPIKQRETWYNMLIQNDINNGVQLNHSLSRYLTVENILYDGRYFKADLINKSKTKGLVINTFKYINNTLQTLYKKSNKLGLGIFEIKDLRLSDEEQEEVNELRSKIKITIEELENNKQDVANYKQLIDILKVIDSWLNDFILGGSISAEDVKYTANELTQVVVKEKSNIQPSTQLLKIKGYRIKYTGPETITLTRMSLNNETSQIQVEPNSYICINMAEVTLLAGRPDVQGLLSNGKIIGSMLKLDKTGKYDCCYIKYTDERAIGEYEPAAIQEFVDQQTLEKFFVIQRDNGNKDYKINAATRVQNAKSVWDLIK